MKKITKTNLQGLRQLFPVLGKEEMRCHVGGNSDGYYGNDWLNHGYGGMILMGITIGMVDIQKMNLIIGKVHGMGAGCMDWGMFILMLIFMVTKEGLARVIMALVTMDTGMLIMDTGIMETLMMVIKEVTSLNRTGLVCLTA